MKNQSVIACMLAAASTVFAGAAIYPAQVMGRAPAITNAPVPFFRPRELEIRQVTSVVTMDPEERPDFMGWYQTNSDQAQYCDAGQTWTSSGNYARCCGTSTTCAQTLLCQSQTLMLDADGVTWTCPSGFQCGTITVFDQWPKSQPRSNFLCANEGWSAWTMYRHISTTDSSSASSIASGTIPDGQALPQASTGPQDGNNENSGDSGSKAWIAGAVIGPIIGLAIIAGTAFLLWRRKKNAADRPVEAPNTNYAHPGASNFVMHEQHTDYKPAMYDGGYYNNSGAYGANGQVNEWRQGLASPHSEGGYAAPSEADSNPVHGHYSSVAPAEMPAEAYMERK